MDLEAEREHIRQTLGHERLTKGQRFAEFLVPGSIRRRQEAAAFERAMEIDEELLRRRREARRV